MDEQTRSLQDDDPIRRLQEEYTERLWIWERRDRIESRVFFAFLWCFFSFWALGALALLFRPSRVTFPLVGGAVACGLVVTLLVFPLRDGLFPKGEPGLLGWWDEWRKSR